MDAETLAGYLGLAAEFRAESAGTTRDTAMADAVEPLAAEVRRLTALTMAIDLLQAENAALRAEVAKMAPLWHMHHMPPDGVTFATRLSSNTKDMS